MQQKTKEKGGDEKETKITPADVCFFFILPFIYSPLLIDYDALPKLAGYFLFSIGVTLAVLRPKKIISGWSGLSPALLLIFSSLLLILFLQLFRARNMDMGFIQFIKTGFFLLMFFPLRVYFMRWFSGKYEWFNLTALFLILIAITQMISNGYFLPGTKSFLRMDLEISSTLANKNFFSDSLIGILPFSVIAFFDKNASLKKANGVFLFLIIGMILLLQSLSSWIALTVFGIIFFWRSRNEITFPSGKKFRIIFLSMAAGFSLLFFGLIKSGKLHSVEEKTSLAFKYATKNYHSLILMNDVANQNSMFERALLFKNAAIFTLKHPLFGIGCSNWLIDWPSLGIGGAPYLNTGVMHFEHPHNEFLFYAAEDGLPFLFLFFLLIGWMIRKSISVSNSSRSKSVHLKTNALIAGIFAFLLLCCFSYPLHRPFSTVLFSFMLVALTASEETEENTTFKNKVWLFFSGMIIPAISLVIIYHQIAGEYHMCKAINHQRYGRMDKMEKEIELAENDFYKVDDRGTPLNWYRGFALFHSGKPEEAWPFFLAAEKQNPYHIQVLSDIGAMYENKGDHENASVYFKKALNIVPLHNESQYNLAVSLFNSGKIKEAYDLIFSIKWEPFKLEPAQMAIMQKVLYDEAVQLPVSDSLKSEIIHYLYEKYILRRLIAKKVKNDLQLPDDLINIKKISY